MSLSDYSDTFQKTVVTLIVLLLLAGIVTYYSQKATNEAYADGIINDIWSRAEQKRNMLTSKTVETDAELTNYMEKSKIGRWGFFYTVLDESTVALVKVETAHKSISHGVCKVLKEKLAKNQWQGVFDKVMVLDKLRDEKLDILIHNCPIKFSIIIIIKCNI